jgi:hypothetical protein
LTFADGATITLQATRGMTRPDVVVKKDGTDIAWFDITSDASEGHHLLKHSTRWKTMPNVAEIVYPALVPAHLGAGAMDLRDRERAIANAAEARTVEEKMRARLEELQGTIPEPVASNNQTVKRQTIETAIGQAFGFPKAPPRLAKGLLRLLGRNLGHYGYKGAHAKGLDTEAAKELIYGDAVMTLQAGDERAYNLNALAVHADFNPPTAGLPMPGLFGEPDTVTGTVDVPQVPFVRSFAQPAPVQESTMDVDGTPYEEYDMLGDEVTDYFPQDDDDW